MKVQPWPKVNFPGVPMDIADTHGQIEFRSQTAAQTDCLLQYKVLSKTLLF